MLVAAANLLIMGKRFWQIFFYSLVSGALTGLAYALSYFGKFDLRNLWEHHLEIAFAACSIGAILGAIFSPVAYYCLKDKNLIIIVPLLYSSAFVAITWMTLIGNRIGNDSLGLLVLSFSGSWLFF